MNKSKMLIYSAIGLTALIVAMSRNENVKNAVASNAKKLKKRLKKMSSHAGDELSELKDLVSNKIEGLGEDARQSILEILEKGSQAANRGQARVRQALQ